MFEMMKVFDSQDMPTDTLNFFFETSEQGNYCYVSHEVLDRVYLDEQEDGTEIEVESEEYTIIDKWLLENGAVVGEYVLIKHWW